MPAANTYPKHTTRPLYAIIAALVALLAALMISGCSTVSIGEQEPQEPVSQILPTKLAIVHTGGIGGVYGRTKSTLGLSAVCQVKHDLQEDGYDVLLVDSGNSLGGSLLADIDSGESAVGFLNAAEYDAIALGKLELDLGGKTLKKRMSQSNFAYLSANVQPTGSQGMPARANATFKLSDGRTVGIFGLTAPDVQGSLGLLASGEVTFSYHELSEIAQQQVDDLKAQGCRLVICLANLGFDEQGLPRANSIASQVSGIDVLLDASTGGTAHLTQDNYKGESTLVVETAPILSQISVVTWEQGELDVEELEPKDATQLDERVSTLVGQSTVDLTGKLERVITTSREALAPDRSLSDSAGLGQLAADAIWWSSKRGMGKSPDAAIITAEALAGSLPAGNVTQLNAMTVLSPATTRLCAIETTGTRLQGVLAPLLKGTAPTQAMPQVAGIEFDQTPATEQQPASRTIKAIGGRAFQPNETYTIVTTEPLLSGSGALSGLYANGMTVTDLESNGGKALTDYLQQECKDGIPDRYFPAP